MVAHRHQRNVNRTTVFDTMTLRSFPIGGETTGAGEHDKISWRHLF